MGLRPRLTWRSVAVLFVLGALGFALPIAYAPEQVPPSLRQQIQTLRQDLDTRLILFFAGAIGGIYALLSAWVWRTNDTDRTFPTTDPEAVSRDVSVTGSTVTNTFERQRTGTPKLDPTTSDALKSSLREALLTLYTRELDSREAARQYVDEGNWTDDSYAAAFLTETDAVDYPFRHRLYAWLYPGEAYETRTRHALRAVEATYAELNSRYDEPARTQSRLQGLRETLLGLTDARTTEDS